MANTKFSLSITGGQKKGDSMTIFAEISGSNCDSAERRVEEILVHGSGAGYPYAADFTNASITAYHNGQQIVGHRRYKQNPPVINDLILHADPAFMFNPETDTVIIHVNGMVRGNVGGMGLGVYLMEKERNESPAYQSCISGYKVYNTITPLSDSELIAGTPNDWKQTPTVTTRPTRAPSPTATISFTPTPTLTVTPTAIPTPRISNPPVDTASNSSQLNFIQLLWQKVTTLFNQW